MGNNLSHRAEDYAFVPIMGLGSFLAWINLSGLHSSLFPWLSNSFDPFELFIASCGFLLTIIVMVVWGERFTAAKQKRVLASMATAVSFIALSIILFLEQSSTVLTMMCYFLCSAGASLLLLLWGDRLSRSSGALSRVTIAGAFLFACTFFLVASLPVLSQIVLFLLPVLLVISGLSLFILSLREDPLSTDSEQGQSTKPYPARNVFILFCLLLILVFTSELVRALSTLLYEDPDSAMASLTQIGGFIAVFLVLILLFFVSRQLDFNASLRILLPLLVTGYLLAITVKPTDSVPFVLVLLGCGSWLLQLLIWTVLSDIVCRFSLSAFKAFALTYGGIFLSFLFAKMLTGSTMQQASAGNEDIKALSVIAGSVVLVVIVAMVLLRDRFLATIWPEVKDGPEVNMAGNGLPDMCKVTEEFSLTPREKDVFQLLAKGRSLPFIQKELQISVGTAQTHVRHIYNKMNVHTRQEFLDLVERFDDS